MQVLDTQRATKRSFVFFLVPEFTILPFAAATEVLRIANRMLGFEAYKWRLASIDGQAVMSSSGLQVTTNTSLTEERRKLATSDRPNMALVCSGSNVEHFSNKAVLAWLRESANRGIHVGSLCTGAYILAQAGLLNGKRCAIHWENLPGFAEAFPEVEVNADLYAVDGAVHTCAGGTAALEMILDLVSQDFDSRLLSGICEQVLADRIRERSDRQRLPLRARLGVQNSKVLSIVEIMEENISDPLALLEIAGKVGLSRRQIERLFRQEMGRSPARYYLEMRVERARHLLVQTTMAVVDVAVACGFISASHFSKCYREFYNRSPQLERTEHRARQMRV